MIPLGRILRELRDEKALSQDQLAQRVGVTSSIIAFYELGEGVPALPTLIKLSRVLGVTTDYLLGLTVQKEFFLDVSELTPKQIESLNLIIENYRAL